MEQVGGLAELLGSHDLAKRCKVGSGDSISSARSPGIPRKSGYVIERNTPTALIEIGEVGLGGG